MAIVPDEVRDEPLRHQADQEGSLLRERVAGDGARESAQPNPAMPEREFVPSE